MTTFTNIGLYILSSSFSLYRYKRRRVTICAALFATMGTVLHKEGHGSRTKDKENKGKEEDKEGTGEGEEEMKGEVVVMVVMVMVVGVGHWM